MLEDMWLVWKGKQGENSRNRVLVALDERFTNDTLIVIYNRTKILKLTKYYKNNIIKLNF